MTAATLPQRYAFRNDRVRIAYIDEGEGEPILLIHGFASNATINWVSTGWVRFLTEAGYRVIALDNRGHGDSDSFIDPAAYTPELLASDSAALLDHLGIPRADVIGYSMGGRIGAALAIGWPEKVRSLTMAGVGANMLHGSEHAERIARALEAATSDEITDPVGLTFRTFAERTRSNLAALAACMRGQALGFPPGALAKLAMPVLIVVGTEDRVAISAGPLLTAMPQAEYLPLPGRDHMKAVGDLTFKRGVLAFLKRRP